MTIPDDAPKDIYDYKWEFMDGNEKKIIVTTGEYPDVTWDFIGVETKLIEKGYEPAIYDFTIEINNNDLTKEILNEEKLVIYISYDLQKFSSSAINDMFDSAQKAKENGYKIIGLTASSVEERNSFIKYNNLIFDFYTCDETALKTIIRSNPGAIIYLTVGFETIYPKEKRFEIMSRILGYLEGPITSTNNDSFSIPDKKFELLKNLGI